MNKIRFSLTSICLSCIGIIWALVIERKIYLEFIASTGKTRALFSLIELGYLEVKIYIVVIGIFALVLGIIGLIRKEHKRKAKIAIGLSILTIILPIAKIWRWLI
jgi:hypothetical protein